ncbi:uncharacterized protein BHQ10_000678 [Talaromyces amestolkiae]|uniref:Uncharacterized protein n=1 Tax=Talaromyces amestolkiae TaxID=1196081 RepID=A0A364KM89_TALAM|nr:uncharacterized protein BHQ10_000678 [Talaromyces amestolkiae]RAO64666.1 hypothetical protein BHQ10_000678 [Talaromyces amestolkiae]
MNNNRYNLRSSAQPQIAPSFYPTSSTTGTATTGAGSTSTTTSTTGVSSSSFLPTQSTFQSGQAQQFQAQPGQFIGQQAQQQQHLFADTQAHAHAQAQQNMNTILPTQAQVQPGQMTLGGPAATAPFLQDFTLVAEAVKRVQMDAVMTEMESITL